MSSYPSRGGGPIYYRCVTDEPEEREVRRFEYASRKKKLPPGVIKNKGGRPKIDVDIKDIIKYRGRGFSLKQIAKICACSVEYVHSRLPDELKGDWDEEAGEFRERRDRKDIPKKIHRRVME